MADQPGLLRVGIVSAAWGATAHLPAWRSLDGVEVTAICTSRPETAARAAREHDIPRAFHDFRAMAADPEIDIMDCGTRPPLRHAMVVAALENGKHVYNGIPFAKDWADARDMAAAWRRAGTVAAVDAFMPAVPAMVQMKAMIAEGWIGDTFGAEIAFDAPLFTAAQTNVPGYVWFADPANGASALRNLGSHMLHQIVDTFGPISSVVADQWLSLTSWPIGEGNAVTPEVADGASVLIRMQSGLPVRMSANWSKMAGDGFRFSAWGSRGRLETRAPVFPMAHDTQLFGSQDPALGTATLEPIEIAETYKRLDSSSALADDPATGLLPMAAIFISMLAEIRGEGRAMPNFERALHVQAAIEAADRSASERRWVDMTEFEDGS